MAYLIYWIHEDTHDDPFTQGYIGITNNLTRRLSAHKKHNDNPIIKNKIYNSLVTIIQNELTKEQALIVEEQYRPVENIGWNVNKGGFMPPSRKGKKLSNTKHVLLGEQRTEKQKQASLEHSIRMKEVDRDSLVKRLPSQKGRVRSELSKQRYKEAAASRPVLICPHCGKTGSGPAMRRWHFDECKQRGV